MCWSSLLSPSVQKYIIILTTESDICFIAYLELLLRGFYIAIVNLQIPVYHMYAFMPAELPELFLFSLSLSRKTQPHLGLHKDPRCAARPEFLRDATTQLINQRDGWLIRHVGAKVHMCDPGQGDCTRLHFKSHTHTQTEITVVELATWIVLHLAQLQLLRIFLSACVHVCVWSCTHSWGYRFGLGERGELRVKERVDPLSWMSSGKGACSSS